MSPFGPRPDPPLPGGPDRADALRAFDLCAAAGLVLWAVGARVGRSALAQCPDLPRIAERWEAWWRFKAPRPLLRVSVPQDPNIRWDKGFDLLEQPSQWIALRRRQVERSYRVGEEIPFVRVDLQDLRLQ